eukprot:184324-Chlamydomonas_euryale.AAC.8
MLHATVDVSPGVWSSDMQHPDHCSAADTSTNGGRLQSSEANLFETQLEPRTPSAAAPRWPI